MSAHPIRKRMRLSGFDYGAPGAYFVTVCIHKRACILSPIEGADVILSPLGEVVRDTWLQLPLHFPCTEVDAFVLMPNHVHCILTLHGRGTKSRTQSAVGDRDNTGDDRLPRAKADCGTKGFDDLPPRREVGIGHRTAIVYHVSCDSWALKRLRAACRGSANGLLVRPFLGRLAHLPLELSQVDDLPTVGVKKPCLLSIQPGAGPLVSPEVRRRWLLLREQ